MERPPIKQQKDMTISLYSLIAFGQSMIWLLVLPDLCRPIWPLIFDNIQSPTMKEVVLNQTTTLTFIIGTLIMLPIYYIQHPFFEQFKIVKDKKWPWLDDDASKREEFWLLTYKSIQYSIFNLLCMVPFFTVLKCYITTALLNRGGNDGDDDDGDGKEDTPVLLSFEHTDNEWPSKIESIIQIIILTILHEFLFHTSHKLMHKYPSLYKYHKVHHQYKNNIIHASQHFHPMDYILSIASPVVICLLIVQPHSVTQFQWAIYVIVANLDDHIGYSFPFSPVRWFPLAALTQEHEFHHCVNIGCYSSKLNVFETLFGTDVKFFKWEEKRIRNLCISSNTSICEQNVGDDDNGDIKKSQ